MILVSMILKAKGNQVVNVMPDATVAEALQLMAEKNIGAIMVMDKGKPVGIFSERDFVREVSRDQCITLKMPVETYMTKDLYCVTPSSNIDECMALMTNKHIRHLPVMEGEELVGIISIGDIVKNMIEDKDLLIDNLQSYIFGASFGR
ncbi:MAG: histidine kinase [Chloroflexi bacterium HGW-Chloroflexi-4]|nr:MAG: histidine kinase [Chloroflexi bacterium HGW-Chloroflexi-7]PKN97624.1 MAG: histidine kinase [Chloroflexi bacterium HGW-Chloroflexi-4]